MKKQIIIFLRPLPERELALKTAIHMGYEIAICDMPNSSLYGLADYGIPVSNIRNQEECIKKISAFFGYFVVLYPA